MHQSWSSKGKHNNSLPHLQRSRGNVQLTVEGCLRSMCHLDSRTAPPSGDRIWITLACTKGASVEMPLHSKLAIQLIRRHTLLCFPQSESEAEHSGELTWWHFAAIASKLKWGGAAIFLYVLPEPCGTIVVYGRADFVDFVDIVFIWPGSVEASLLNAKMTFRVDGKWTLWRVRTG